MNREARRAPGRDNAVTMSRASLALGQPRKTGRSAEQKGYPHASDGVGASELIGTITPTSRFIFGQQKISVSTQQFPCA